MSNKPKDKSVNKKINYFNMFYKTEEQLPISKKHFLELKEATNEATGRRAKFVFGEKDPIGRTEVAFGHEDLGEFDIFVNSLHEAFVKKEFLTEETKDTDELFFTGEEFMMLKDMINRTTLNRTRLVYGKDNAPIGRTEVGYENEDIRAINTFVDLLHKKYVDEGRSVKRETLLKELKEMEKAEQN